MNDRSCDDGRTIPPWMKWCVYGLATLAALALLWQCGNSLQTNTSFPNSKAKPVRLPSTPNDAMALEKTLAKDHISALVTKPTSLDEVAIRFYATLPASLSGSPAPAKLRMDEHGNLLIEKRLQNLFEYYLSAIGEEPLESIVARIKYDLEIQLDAQALAQALELLDGYLQYRNNVGVIKNEYAASSMVESRDLAVVKQMKQAVRDSRQEFMPQPAIESFFGEEDQYDDYMMARAEIVSNSALSDAAQKDALELLNLSSPARVVEARQRLRQIAQVRSDVALMRQSGASSDQVYGLREREFGADAAQRLEALDSRRQAWNAQILKYRNDLKALKLGADYPAAQIERMTETLRRQHFDEEDLARVRSLDSIERSTASDD